MATSTRPRRAASPAPADEPARTAAPIKKPAAKKSPAKPASARRSAAEPDSPVAAAEADVASPPEPARAARKTPEAKVPAAAPKATRKAPQEAPPEAPQKAPQKATQKAGKEPPPKVAQENAPAAKKTAAKPATPKAGATAAAKTAPRAARKTAAQAGPEGAPKPAAAAAAEAAPEQAAPATANAKAPKKTAAKGRAATTPDREPAAARKTPARHRTAPAAATAKAAEAVEPIDLLGAAEDVADAVAPSAPTHPTEPVAPARPPAPDMPPAPAVPAVSAVVLLEGEHRQLRWIAGRDCPDTLHAAAAACTDEAGLLQLDDDDALPALLREAAQCGHTLQVDPAAWQQLAHRRDARQRLFALEHAYPDGPASAALHGLLRAPLAPFQAEGALFAACAGRALLADERGLGKTVQALAAAVLLHRHAGVERVLIHCNAEQRLSWQREAARFLGAGAPEWRVVTDEPGGPHAEAIDAWKPGLVVIDEPARLARWDRIDAPFALVLCGTPLESDAALAEALVAYLDRHREGPLARLHARTASEPLDEALQAMMLRRRRAEVLPQLPPCVVSERVLPLGPLQRAVHDRAAAAARAVLAGWRRTRHLPDAQQWELGGALQAMREACHRAEPGQADSALADHTLAALSSLASEMLGHAGLQFAVVAPRPSDVTQLAERLAPAGERCTVLGAGATLPPQAEVVVAVGMPWQPPAADERPRQWIHLLAEHSIDTALYDTRELRAGIASTPAEGGRDGFLHGAALQRYLLAAEAALSALDVQPGG